MHSADHLKYLLEHAQAKRSGERRKLRDLATASKPDAGCASGSRAACSKTGKLERNEIHQATPANGTQPGVEQLPVVRADHRNSRRDQAAQTRPEIARTKNAHPPTMVFEGGPKEPRKTEVFLL